MSYNESKFNDIVRKAKLLCDPSIVDVVEEHYAGYWDELGLFIKVLDAATDEKVIDMRNSLLNLLEQELPRGKADFTWLVTFKRAGETIEVLFPGDGIRDTSEVLCPL